MIALFLLLVIAAIVLGIVGVVAKGLLYLLFIGIVVFLGALLLGALRMRRRPGRRQARNSPPVTLDASVYEGEDDDSCRRGCSDGCPPARPGSTRLLGTCSSRPLIGWRARYVPAPCPHG